MVLKYRISEYLKSSLSNLHNHTTIQVIRFTNNLLVTEVAESSISYHFAFVAKLFPFLVFVLHPPLCVIIQLTNHKNLVRTWVILCISATKAPRKSSSTLSEYSDHFIFLVKLPTGNMYHGVSYTTTHCWCEHLNTSHKICRAFYTTNTLLSPSANLWYRFDTKIFPKVSISFLKQSSKTY